VSVSVIRSPFLIRNHNNSYITQQTNQLLLYLQFSILKSFKPSVSLQIQFKFNPIIHSFLKPNKKQLKTHHTQKKKKKEPIKLHRHRGTHQEEKLNEESKSSAFSSV